MPGKVWGALSFWILNPCPNCLSVGSLLISKNSTLHMVNSYQQDIWEILFGTYLIAFEGRKQFLRNQHTFINKWLRQRQKHTKNKQTKQYYTHTQLCWAGQMVIVSLLSLHPSAYNIPSLPPSRSPSSKLVLSSRVELCFTHRKVPRGLHVSCSPDPQTKIYLWGTVPLSQDRAGKWKATWHISISHV